MLSILYIYIVALNVVEMTFNVSFNINFFVLCLFHLQKNTWELGYKLIDLVFIGPIPEFFY